MIFECKIKKRSVHRTPLHLTANVLIRNANEELGHFIQKAYYPLGDCCDALKLPNLMKQERKAKDYAVRLQVPLCELKTALKKSQDDYELAETLDVDLDVLSAAVEYYKRKGMI